MTDTTWNEKIQIKCNFIIISRFCEESGVFIFKKTRQKYVHNTQYNHPLPHPAPFCHGCSNLNHNTPLADIPGSCYMLSIAVRSHICNYYLWCYFRDDCK